MHVGRGCDHRLRRRGQLDRQGVRRRRPRGPLRRHRRRPGRGPAGPGLRGDDHRRPARPALVRLPDPADPEPGHRYDLSAFVDGTRAVGRALAGASAFHTVVVRSTVPPGTCDGRPAAARAGLGPARRRGLRLASNPEFLRAATALEDFLFPWMTVVGARSRRRRPALPPHPELRRRAPRLRRPRHRRARQVLPQHLQRRQDQLLERDVAGLPPPRRRPRRRRQHRRRSAEASFNPDYGIRGGAPYGGACLPRTPGASSGSAVDRRADADCCGRRPRSTTSLAAPGRGRARRPVATAGDDRLIERRRRATS